MQSRLQWSRLFAVFAFLVPATAACIAAETRDGVFIHISHGPGDRQRLLMALNMAPMMSPAHPVFVHFGLKASESALKDSKGVQRALPIPETQLGELAKKGVTLMACPGWLKAAGKRPADLAPGIQVADKATFFSLISGSILEFDY